jgi:hypothetical protein
MNNTTTHLLQNLKYYITYNIDLYLLYIYNYIYYYNDKINPEVYK